MKYTTKINKSSQSSFQQDTSGSQNGVSMAPPEYRIDFADNYSGSAKKGAPGSVSEIQNRLTSTTVCTACTRSASASQFPIQRKKLEEEEEVQMMADAAQMVRTGTEVEPAVKAGIQQARGSGKSLDDSLQDWMSAEFSYNFDGVRVHTDAEADALNRRLGAKAFTTGSDIFFKQGKYEPASSSGKKLIAHELSHVVQQGTGRVRSSGDGLTVRPSDDAFEREADARARHSVNAGPKGGKGPAATIRSMSFSKGQHSQSTRDSTLQRYVEKTDTDGDDWRVSESGNAALWVKEAEGGQTLFAAPKLVKEANLKLTKAGKNGSFIRLKDTGTRLKSGLLKGVSSGVRAIEPRLVTVGPDPGNKKLKNINLGLRADDDGSKSKEFALWADCGRSSRVVMGTDDTGGLPRAHVRMGSKQYVTSRSGDPANFTIVYRAAMPKFMSSASNMKYLKEGVHYDLDAKNKKIMKTPADDKAAKKMYWELGSKGRRAFDFYAGINVAADPEIGGGYTMATEYDMPGFKAKGSMTWNFHWAGVVMKDGDNNVTLENYAVSYGTSPDPVENQRLQEKAYNEVNRAWVFQMYGTRKKGQTFHEQHLKSGTHGTRGSSFAVKV